MLNGTNRGAISSSRPAANRPLLRSPQDPNLSPHRTGQQAVVPASTMSPRARRSLAQHPLSYPRIVNSHSETLVGSPSPSHRVPSQGPGVPSPLRAGTAPNFRAHSSRSNNPELKMDVHNLPADWDTGKIYGLLKQYGTITRIEIVERRGNDPSKAWVIFSPRPQTTDWISNGLIVQNQRVRFSPWSHSDTFRHKSPKDSKRDFAEEIKIPCSELKFGVMESSDHLLVLQSIKTVVFAEMEVKANVKRKVLDIDFAMAKNGLTSATASSDLRSFKMRLNFTQIQSIVQIQEDGSGRLAWVISMEHPPLLYRKTDFVDKSHENGATSWSEWVAWNRQTEIAAEPGAAQNAIIQLQKATSCIDIGRWLSYLLIYDEAAVVSPAFAELSQALGDHDVQITKDKNIGFGVDDSKSMWNWLNNSSATPRSTDISSTFELHQLAQEMIHLPFNVRYQLEVCISQGLLHECNISKDFLGKLATMDHQRAVKLLEKVADEKERFYAPDDIFRTLMHKVSIQQKPVPSYCAMVRAATVTPTTIYFMTPLLETSNRVIRKFQHYEDRFLRVKFTDEKYQGKVQSRSDATMNEVYTRIKRAMTNGIRVGDRHYKFLAFGNSQFREHGAWFFASTTDLTAQRIREKIGNFSNIKIVAKYCSRVGQCFSTTRATRWSIEDAKIPDIKRGSFCFTDGVGKISQFLAQMIAQELGYPSSISDCPSAFQFRREGCKGILVVDPSLTKHTIQIRPSQEKFSGTSHRGLEIVRVAQFSTAYLNIQLVLVLSTLGVEDIIFVRKMRNALRDLEEAVHSESKALELLQKNIDYNHMTIQLASMILDGFMEASDPFTISCLRLWRSWSVKYLKEKARIFVENGAFVLGCVDETATLKGHFEHSTSIPEDHQDISSLPEVFLQIDSTGEGKWQVIEGVCTLARNPSLHPGDVRVVRAVDIPALHHIRNCVVFPQTGDRDIPNMCSGGDLDGDDYLVMWDEDLIPKERNHPPMNYTAPPAVSSDGDVTVDDMTSFFVQHMKNDNLGPIAVAHRYWADRLDDGVKEPTCLKLAELHSMAVDYVKTGCPAKMPKTLHVKMWPHWAEPKNKPRSKIYHSKKVIGKLYDEVQGVDFEPAWRLPFDQRVLEAYKLDQQILKDAYEIKQQYDTTMRRVMAKFSIENEFEVWTTFVRNHSEEMGDYKIAETVGEASSALKDTYQKLCYEKAGTTHQERDWSKMGPFVAAMYTTTANEVTATMMERNKTQYKGGKWVPVDAPSVRNMPLMSFPWLFPAELGRIANKRDHCRTDLSHKLAVAHLKPAKKSLGHLLDGDMLDELEEIIFPRDDIDISSAPTRRDSSFSTPGSDDTRSMKPRNSPKLIPQPSNLAFESVFERSFDEVMESNMECIHDDLRNLTDANVSEESLIELEVSDDEDQEDVETVTISTMPSALHAFGEAYGF